MACFWSQNEEYQQNLRIKNSIIKLKRLDRKAIIKLYCNQADINVQKELDKLNKLYDKFNISSYGFDRFFDSEKLCK